MSNPKQPTITLADGSILTLRHSFVQHDEDSETTLEKHIYIDKNGKQHIKYFSYQTSQTSPKEPMDSRKTSNK